jgi:hypothetical protein
MVGPDRRVIYAMVDCHDGQMIPPQSSARRGHLGRDFRDSGGLGKYQWPSEPSRGLPVWEDWAGRFWHGG